MENTAEFSVLQLSFVVHCINYLFFVGIFDSRVNYVGISVAFAVLV